MMLALVLLRMLVQVAIAVDSNVGPPFLKRAPIMSFGACLFRIRAMMARPPVTCFDLGALKI